MTGTVFDYARQGSTLVCASSRLARRLRHRFAQLQLSAGKKAWPTPDILPWGAWLQRCWQDSINGPDRDLMLLSGEQEIFLWQRLIRKTAASRLLQLTATGRQAHDAWRRVRDWRIPVFPAGCYLNEDAIAFREWSAAYQQQCREQGLIDQTCIPELLVEQAVRPPTSVSVVLAGFDDLTPLQQYLIDGLGRAGVDIKCLTPVTGNPVVNGFGLADRDAEIRAAAMWARRLLERGNEDNIGIVVRDLRTLHGHIENILDDVLLPGSILHGAAPLARPYSIAQGQPLARYALIKTALDILELGALPIDIELLGSVIRSPFIRGAQVESQDRARFDALLRKNGEYRMRLGSLEYYGTRQSRTSHPPAVLLGLCRDYLQVMAATPGKRPAAEWAAIFTGLLKCFGWPGDRTLDSMEYQTVAEWHAVLEKFSFLDPAGVAVDYHDALTRLRQLAAATGFQPETAETPLQVMGMSGAAAMQFDQLWVLGLDEESWPEPAHPNPFIPVALQARAGIPGATAELALARADRDTQRLIGSAHEVVLSYAMNDGDRPLRPSPLIRPYMQARPAEADIPKDYAALQFASRRMVTFVDDMAPALAPGQAVAGGTALFADQAACPFRACARHRLHAEGIERQDIGLDARVRGSIMHEVMQRLWVKLSDHATLVRVEGAELDEIINRCIRSVLSAFRKKYPVTFDAGFVRLEAARIGAVVQDWLQLEQQRPPFLVSELEHQHLVSLGGISVNTRIDRIDRLQDGREVIIDYKTGDPGIGAWLGERPDDPQLPLYAIAARGDIAAVVFARLKRGLVAFIGLAQNQDLLPGVTAVEDVRGGTAADWHELLEAWRRALTQLARDFRQGDARVDPKKPDTCSWCDLHSLCRIYEQGMVDD